MLSGSTTTTAVFVMASHHLLAAAGGSGGGDEPRNPWSIKSAHELDAAAPRRRNPAAAAGGAFQFQCPICKRVFATRKAVHGHMRCHQDRPWRGMEPPRSPPPGELAADGKRYSYMCDRCRAPFEKRQGLGGHRASHGTKKGCYWYSKLDQLAAAAQKPPVLDFDLNDPAQEMDEEEQ